MSLSKEYNYILAQEGFFDIFRSWQNKSEVELWIVDIGGNHELTSESTIWPGSTTALKACENYFVARAIQDDAITSFYSGTILVPKELAKTKVVLKKYVFSPKEVIASVKPHNNSNYLDVRWKSNVKPAEVVETTIPQIAKRLGRKVAVVDKTLTDKFRSKLGFFTDLIKKELNNSELKDLAECFEVMLGDATELLTFVNGITKEYPLVGLFPTDKVNKIVNEKYHSNLYVLDEEWYDWIMPKIKKVAEAANSKNTLKGISIAATDYLSEHAEEAVGFVLKRAE